MPPPATPPPTKWTLDKTRYLGKKALLEAATVEVVDEETGEVRLVKVEQKKKPEHRGKPLTPEQADDLRHRALVSEGQVLYYRGEFVRAIEAFTKAIQIGQDTPKVGAAPKPNTANHNVLVDRANCYIRVGDWRAAVTDINTVLAEKPTHARAILAKAEAFFSRGEFEFALVFFQRGKQIRNDISAFSDGIAKCTHAILDAIRGDEVYQPNPLFAEVRTRQPLFKVEEETPFEEAAPEPESVLLPEPVEPLAVEKEAKADFLGEVRLDYEYLVELREELLSSLQDPNSIMPKEVQEEDKKALKFATDALHYLDARAQFWSQQAPLASEKPLDQAEAEESYDGKRQQAQTSRMNPRDRDKKKKRVLSARGAAPVPIRPTPLRPMTATPGRERREQRNYEMTEIERIQQRLDGFDR